MPATGQTLRKIVTQSQKELLAEWVQAQLGATTLRSDLMKEGELREQSRELLALLQAAVGSGDIAQIEGSDWASVRDFLAKVSRSRAQQGFSPSETATFVLSLKQPLFTRLRGELSKDAQAFADEIWATTDLLDKLALFTVETYVKSREELIQRQQREMMELSTPVVQLWDSILALPLIGTLDSERTQVVIDRKSVV